MNKKTSFDFGSNDDVAAAVDRFAPPDSTGKLKKLRDELLSALPDKKDLTASEAAELVSLKLFAAGLNKDEVEYAVTRLFVSNAYFKDMVLGIVSDKINAFPSIESDNGESVYVDGSSSNPPESAAIFTGGSDTTEVVGSHSDESNESLGVEDVEVDEVGTNANYTIAVDVAVDEDHSVILTTEDETYKEIQESNDEDVTAKVVEEVAQDVVDFGEMKLPELKKYAADNGIDLTGLTKKPEIVARLIEETQARGEY